VPTQVRVLSLAYEKMKKITKTDKHLVNLIQEIKEHAAKEDSGFWKRIAKELSNSTRRRRSVNIAKINQYTKEGEMVVVPGKVLGVGELDHNVTIAALEFSESALVKIKNNMTIGELLKKSPKGKDVRILG
jgi:large subunit ribosomal protein L18e